ncbi:MAG: hypothetical protein JO036_07180 [Candidatus Eremiobacteraeota bacterium]|nr:hypothetical protein [Candidatus Eremiobacteraeota bacterium]
MTNYKKTPSAKEQVMKNIAHLFEPRIVKAAFQTLDVERQPTKKFELIAALVMHRVYEHQWSEPTKIGFYLSQKAADVLQNTTNPDHSLLVRTLCDGIAEDNDTDFYDRWRIATLYARVPVKTLRLRR